MTMLLQQLTHKHIAQTTCRLLQLPGVLEGDDLKVIEGDPRVSKCRAIEGDNARVTHKHYWGSHSKDQSEMRQSKDKGSFRISILLWHSCWMLLLLQM